MIATNNSLKMMQDSIKELLEQLKQVRAEKALAIEQAVGDGWHDNFAFEQATMQENMIIKRIINLQDIIDKAKVIETGTLNSNNVVVGSIVNIRINYSDQSSEELDIKLVDILTKGQLEEATLNSPIGRELLYKKVGEHGNYILENGEKIEFEVLSIN